MASEKLEPIPLKLFAEFVDYFGRVFDPICGGYILLSILPPQIGSKIGSQEPKNRLKLFNGMGS